MFEWLGRVVTRRWALLLAGWAAILATMHFTAPAWDDVIEDGQFSFLPDDSLSRVADEFFNKAFPHDLISSSVVVIVTRRDEQKLHADDLDIVASTLIPRLQEIAGQERIGVDRSAGEEAPVTQPAIVSIHGFNDEGFGSLLRSLDEKATLVIVEMKEDFFSKRNQPVIARIEALIDELTGKGQTGPLKMHLTGSAVVGRDITLGSEQSAAATERWTIVLVVVLTLIVFRAPLLALIPLVTLFVSMEAALNLLALLAKAGVIEVFRGIEAYTTVVAYASGVDFSLFIISRVEEEFGAGKPFEASVRDSMSRVGAAVCASGATEIVGIGMLSFASFGKFHQAGIAISLSLLVMLAAVLTITPALLCLIGRHAFWPHARRDLAHEQDRAPTLAEKLWHRVGELIQRRPGAVWLAAGAAMVPFAILGLAWYNHLNYDLVASLSVDAPSAVGTRELQQHFPAGTTGPVNVVIRNDRIDFRESDGFQAIKSLTQALHADREELKIADVRSLAMPLGTTGAGKLAASEGGVAKRLVTAGTIHRRAQRYFITNDPALDSHATRLGIELTINPFSEEAIDFLDVLERGVKERLPDSLQSGTEVQLSGTTASLRDLKAVGVRDRTLINVLVVASVLIILVILLRRFWLSVYLMLTVLFSYLVTLGVTFAVFYALDPLGFSGLDWTVPLFLFTVLVAIGEDYNILLVTRIDEERRHLKPVPAIISALIRTGPIISSCGLIMAGTFLSLMIAGELAQMVQLGFALSFGVLLDTFIVRPILVPAFLICVYRGDFDFMTETLQTESRESAKIGSNR